VTIKTCTRALFAGTGHQEEEPTSTGTLISCFVCFPPCLSDGLETTIERIKFVRVSFPYKLHIFIQLMLYKLCPELRMRCSFVVPVFIAKKVKIDIMRTLFLVIPSVRRGRTLRSEQASSFDRVTIKNKNKKQCKETRTFSQIVNYPCCFRSLLF
jgi:hypothetical protein